MTWHLTILVLNPAVWTFVSINFFNYQNVFLMFIGCCLSLYPVKQAIGEWEHCVCVYDHGAKGTANSAPSWKQKHCEESANAVNSTTRSEPESSRPTAKYKTRSSQGLGMSTSRTAKENRERIENSAIQNLSYYYYAPTMKLMKTNLYWFSEVLALGADKP